jgi:hypothetical protein
MFDIADRRPFWSNIQTTEQCFGLLSFDPGEFDVTCQVDGDFSDWEGVAPTIQNDQGSLYYKIDERYVYLMLDAKDYNFEKDTLLIPINTIDGQGNSKSNNDNVTFDKEADFLIYINGKNNSHIYVDAYYDAFNYYFAESKMLTDFKALESANVKNSGVFTKMNMCYGYNLTVKGTDTVVPDKVYETGKLQFGNSNPNVENYASLTDFCYYNGKLEIRIPWQLLNVMDPSTKQQISNFWTEQVIVPQEFDVFDVGFAYRSNNEAVSISLDGVIDYKEWKIPTWHERLKPAYYQLKDYFSASKE